MTISTLRTLLDMAHGPAVEGKTHSEIIRAYLPAWLSLLARGGAWEAESTLEIASDPASEWATVRLDCTDPGTVNALKTALALALGLDPGPMGVGVRWCNATRHHPDVWRGNVHVVAAHATLIWSLEANHSVWFAAGESFFRAEQIDLRWIDAPAIALEPDPIKALVLACAHVIKEKR